MRTKLSIGIALAGLLLCGFYISKNSFANGEQEPLRDPPKKPYAESIAGVGIVEAKNKAHRIAPFFSGRVAQVFVKEGDQVKAGDLLYRLDTQQLHAEERRLKAEQARVQAQLNRLKQEPRPERTPPAQARVAAASKAYEREKTTLAKLKKAANLMEASISEDQLKRQELLVEELAATKSQAEADLRLLTAGTWELEIQESRQALAAATASLAELNVRLKQAELRSPMASEVLQVNVREGEFVQAGSFNPDLEPSILLGQTDELQVRVDIDEVLASYVRPGMPATAFIKGDASLKIPLNFERIEPFMIPKKSLTGSTAERNDVRVLQVIYSFDPPREFNAYVGQQVEVYLDKAASGKKAAKQESKEPVDAPAA